MSPKRSTRTLMAGALSLSLLAALLAMPIVTFAATPNWRISATDELPDVVKVGAIAGYSATITNDGSSNISQSSVAAFIEPTFTTPSGPTQLIQPGEGGAGPAPVYAAVFDMHGEEIVGACPEPWGAPVVCNTGAIGDDVSVTLVVGYDTTGMASPGVHGWWQSSGEGSSFCTADDNSRGDCLPFHVGATEITNSGNFGGGFSIDPGDLAQTDDINAGNLVSTELTAAADQENLILTVAEEDALSGNPTCPARFAPCISDKFTVELHVGDGSTEFGISTVVIDYHKNLWKTVNFKKLSVLHFHDGELGPGNPHEIEFSSSCSGSTECATFTSLPGGHGRVTLYLAQNGFVKYH